MIVRMKNVVDYIYSKGLYNEVRSLFSISTPYAVIKGKALSVLIYNDVTERITTDLDILCSKSDCKNIIYELKKYGFSELNKNRYDILFSKSFSHQYVPMVKVNKIQRMTVDINFDIFWGEYTGQRISINEFLSDVIELDIYGCTVKTLPPLKAMIQLILHHYKEMNSIYHLAVHNCIKYRMFRDVYYLWKNNQVAISLKKLYAISLQYNIIPYVFYVLYFTNWIFQDADLKKYIKAFETPEGVELLDYYGLTEKERKIWKVDFQTRLETENLYELVCNDLTEADIEKLERNKKIFG